MMEKSKDIILVDLENLLAQKDFSDLNLEEKASVLSEMSEREYRQMRELVCYSREMLRPNRLSPRGDIRMNLQKAMIQEEKGAGIIRFLKYPVPAWQVAAAMILLVLGIHFTKPGSSHSSEKNHIISVADTNTTFADSSFKTSSNPFEDSIMERGQDSL